MPVQHPMQIIKSHDYYHALLRDIPKSRQRIVITAMTIAYDSKTKPIFHMLEQALQRGVAVTLVFDVYIKSPFASGLATYLSRDRHAIKRLLEICERLKSQGATVHLLSTLGINPFAGRYHCKATVIDDTWYSFGGINFCAEGFVHADYMLWGRSKRTADLLVATTHNFMERTIKADFSEERDAATSVLVDIGRKKQSIIYDTACRLAMKAKKVIYVSHLSPSGRLAEALQKSSTTYYFNRLQQLHFPFNYVAILDSFLQKAHNSYDGQKYIHAKFILYELNDGQKVLISGSHNFSWHGVRYGTAEIALMSTDQTLWDSFLSFVQELNEI